MTRTTTESGPSGDRSFRIAPPRSGRIARTILVAMILLWITALLSRNVIRAHWWAHRMAVVESPRERLFYFHRLASLGDRATGAVAALLRSQDVALRSLGVGILHHAPGARARALLLKAGRDPDEDIRRLAVVGLAVRPDPQSAPDLVALAEHSDERTGMIVAAALATVASDSATDALIHLLEASPYPGVRVEAIEGLAQQRTADAIDVLIESLRDEAVFEGWTERDILAARTLGKVRDNLVHDLGLDPDASLNVTRQHIVARRAARALEEITGHAPGSHAEDAFNPAQAAQAWRRWQRLHTKRATDSSP